MKSQKKVTIQDTEKTEKEIFPIYKKFRNSDGIGCMVIYEEGLPNIFNHIRGGRYS
jgi:hypothetical protein